MYTYYVWKRLWLGWWCYVTQTIDIFSVGFVNSLSTGIHIPDQFSWVPSLFCYQLVNGSFEWHSTQKIKRMMVQLLHKSVIYLLCWWRCSPWILLECNCVYADTTDVAGYQFKRKKKRKRLTPWDLLNTSFLGRMRSGRSWLKSCWWNVAPVVCIYSTCRAISFAAIVFKSERGVFEGEEGGRVKGANFCLETNLCFVLNTKYNLWIQLMVNKNQNICIRRSGIR